VCIEPLAKEQQLGMQRTKIPQQGHIRASIAKQWRRRKRALAEVSRNGLALRRLAKDLRRDSKIVLAAVSNNSLALEWAAKALRRDREIVLAAVSECGYALQWAAETFRSDRPIVRAAVSTFGCSLLWATDALRGDREIVMAAVSNCGTALEFAEGQLKSDREVVLAAVSESGFALVFASSELKRDREIALAAARGGRAGDHGLLHADDSLLEDDSFAVEARQSYYSFRVVALSGRTCLVPLHCSEVVALSARDIYEHLMCEARAKLGMGTVEPGEETLLFGAEEVSGNCEVEHWPGSPAPGGVVEYQLVRTKRARTDIV